MAKGQIDKYANLMLVNVLETAANTLTFQQSPQITTLLEKKAFLINAIHYDIPAGSRANLVALGDQIYYGLSLSDRWAAATLVEPTILDYNNIYCQFASGVGFQIAETQMIKDFSTMPGGGLIVPTRPIFLYAQGSSLANPVTVTARVYFTIIDMTPADYWDLVESLQAYS